MSGRVGASLALLLVAGATLWGAGLHQPGRVESSGHSATRAFASPWVAPGGQIEVTITAQNYGAFAQVVETLPEAFRYVGSSLPDAAVDVGPDSVTFTLLGREQFTYIRGGAGCRGVVRLLRPRAGTRTRTSCRSAATRACGLARRPHRSQWPIRRRRGDARADGHPHPVADRDTGPDSHIASDGDACARADGHPRPGAYGNAGTGAHGDHRPGRGRRPMRTANCDCGCGCPLRSCWHWSRVSWCTRGGRGRCPRTWVRAQPPWGCRVMPGEACGLPMGYKQEQVRWPASTAEKEG